MSQPATRGRSLSRSALVRNMAFVFLEQHSRYSLAEGTIALEAMAAEARARGDEYLSLADTNGFYGLINFLRECESAGLRPLIGARLEKNRESALLIARDRNGYGRICELISRLHARGDFSLRAELRPLIEQGLAGVTLITADRELLATSGGQVYAEINVQRQGYYYDYLFAREVGRPPVLIHPVYFARPADFEQHRLLRAVHHNRKIDSLAADERRSEHAWWMPAAEIEMRYGAIMPEALANTERIAQESAFEFEYGRVIFPAGDGDSLKHLRKLAEQGLGSRYPGLERDAELARTVRARLDHELGVIERRGFASYFLVVRDIVRRARYTCGRGSGAASLVSYLLFITHVDPVRHKLYFERFLNLERPDPPDIDIDFAWDEKDGVTAYALNRYGDRAAMVANHISFSHRSSVREAAKVRGLPESEIKRITGGIHEHYRAPVEGGPVVFQEDQDALADRNDLGAVMAAGRSIGGTPRFLGLHCGGVVITPEPMHRHVPVQPSAKGFPMIQWEKEQTEDYGLVKIDVLGNRSLAVVRDCLAAVKANHGVDIPYETFNPIEDEKTRSMLARGETIGVFYVESPAMRQLQRKTGKGDYEHLVIHSSLVRPAANRFIREYIARLKGKRYDPILPEMDEILGETYGIMSYQEDISRIAVALAGFTVGQGDELRRIISKKNKRRRLIQLKELFYKNLSARGVAAAKADRIWEMIESFSGYSFCKPHSASYALLSFKACYLKAHYPAEFLAAVLSNRGGFYSPPAYIAEARRLGIRVLPPHVNHSRGEYRGRGDVIHAGFMEIKGLPVADVRTLLEERRRGGAFRGVLDFMRRTEISAKTTGLLINAGCFAGLERYNQAQLLFMARKYAGAGGGVAGGARRSAPASTAASTGRAAGQGEALLPLGDRAPSRSLAKTPDNRTDRALARAIQPPPLREDSLDRRLAREIETFGFIMSTHPMAYFRRRVHVPEDVVPAVRLGEFVGQRVRTVGILVTSRTLLTRRDELMKFLSFEDEDVLFETVLFPDAHRRQKHPRLSHRAPYLLTGRVESEFGAWYLNIEELRMLGRG